jgi:hypothetical protein
MLVRHLTSSLRTAFCWWEMDATAVSDQKSDAKISAPELTYEESRKVFDGQILKRQICFRRTLVCMSKHHSFREPPEVHWLVKNIRAGRQVMEDGRRLCQIKIAEQTVCRMLERLDTIKLSTSSANSSKFHGFTAGSTGLRCSSWTSQASASGCRSCRPLECLLGLLLPRQKILGGVF